MKNRIKKLITLGVLSLALISNHFVVFAEDSASAESIQEITQPEEEIPDAATTETTQQEVEKPTEPTKPEQPTGEVNNEQIINYNNEVNTYNQEVDTYNTAVDAYNNQIDTNYQQEKAKVDEQNAAVDAHNQTEDAKAAEIKAENEQIQTKYDTDHAKYEEDLATYKEKEEQILNAGYQSVEQYNNTMNTYYNEPLAAAKDGNVKEENTFNIDKSYKIEDGSDSASIGSTDTYEVEINHNFNEQSKDENDEDIDIPIKSYTTKIQIRGTDIITFEPAGAQLETYQNQYHYGFFAKIDEAHVNGLWYLGNSKLEELCNYVLSGWNTGDTHTVSYKDGQSRPGDPNLKMIYNYYWKPLKEVKTYTEPEEPKLELKEEYTPNYQEKVAEPVQEEHLTHLDHLNTMALLPDPEPEKEIPVPAVEIKDEPTPTISTPSVVEETQTQVEKPEPAPAFSNEIKIEGPQKILKAREADTSDSTAVMKRPIIIIGCLAIIMVLLYIGKLRKNDDK